MKYTVSYDDPFIFISSEFQSIRIHKDDFMQIFPGIMQLKKILEEE